MITEDNYILIAKKKLEIIQYGEIRQHTSKQTMVGETNHRRNYKIS